MISITRDTIGLRGAGIIRVAQPVKGHRFTLDSILLADFCRVKPKERVLEPGASTGIISLLLAKKHPRALFYPVEIQNSLHDLCNENCSANNLENVITVHRDIRRLYQSILPGGFDVIVANPPYLRSGAGKTSPDPARRAARQDLLGKIEFWMELQKFLQQGGRYNIVFPASRLSEIFAVMKELKLEPKRLRFVHPFVEKPASRALIEAVKGGGSGVEVLAPLIVHEGRGYSKEMQEIYGMGDEK